MAISYFWDAAGLTLNTGEEGSLLQMTTSKFELDELIDMCYGSYECALHRYSFETMLLVSSLVPGTVILLCFLRHKCVIVEIVFVILCVYIYILKHITFSWVSRANMDYSPCPSVWCTARHNNTSHQVGILVTQFAATWRRTVSSLSYRDRSFWRELCAIRWDFPAFWPQVRFYTFRVQFFVNIKLWLYLLLFTC